jgi:hypothetical protein
MKIIMMYVLDFFSQIIIIIIIIKFIHKLKSNYSRDSDYWKFLIEESLLNISAKINYVYNLRHSLPSIVNIFQCDAIEMRT